MSIDLYISDSNQMDILCTPVNNHNVNDYCDYPGSCLER